MTKANEIQIIPVGSAMVSVPDEKAPATIEHVDFLELWERCPAERYLASLSPGESQRSMRSALTNIAVFCGKEKISDLAWGSLTDQHVKKVLKLITMTRAQLEQPRYQQAMAHLKNKRHKKWAWKPLGPASQRRYLSALRGVAGEAFDMGFMDSEAYERIKRIKAPKGSRKRKTLTIGTDDVIDLMSELMTAGAAKGARDAAVLALLYGCGLRRSEATHLTLEHVNFKTGEVECIGKGDKERFVPMAPWVEDIVKLWLHHRGSDTAGALILPVDRRGAVVRKYDEDGDLKSGSANFIYRITNRIFAKAGFGHIAPHDLRRTFATALIKQGVNLPDVADLMGHSDISTTNIYKLDDSEVRRKAVTALPGLGDERRAALPLDSEID